ncbi:MAG: phosphogluconate dehydrogenase (NADP(+)-dependent, decarboxylating) [Gammaproteobacteria bacterium]|nr:MAG: phosphogluconate dehydrogenase (NADP(+)-dependent, decarboxylating) [Gammaproteobacteria bacterium]
MSEAQAVTVGESGSCDLGLVGLGVMGENLAMNFSDHGYRLALCNRSPESLERFVRESAGRHDFLPTRDYAELAASLARPRCVFLMVKAGDPVDAVIEGLLPHLDEGDIIIDGGNSNYRDTERRVKALAEKGILMLGCGVSGGEEGARHGPSMMPGGNPDAWPQVKDMLQAIAAKTDKGVPCCDWVGEGGAGHYVKMVHNGIEYGDMQLICECYDFMQHLLGMSNADMHEVFAEWNRGELESYLIEITADIMAHREEGTYTLDTILDKAGQKGTGLWTAVNALELGVPLHLITASVQTRMLSALKGEREKAAGILPGPSLGKLDVDRNEAVSDLRSALYAAKILSYAQGYMLMKAAAESHGWKLNYAGIAQMWREGCIIRAVFLEEIISAYQGEPELENLLFAEFFRNRLADDQGGWRRVVSRAAEVGLTMPAMSAALAFYDGYRRGRLPANLLQAQRDYFGAHTYQRVDDPSGEWHHTQWF